MEDGEEFSGPELVHCHMNPKEITEIKEDTNEEIKDDKTVEKRTEIKIEIKEHEKPHESEEVKNQSN